MLVHRRKRSPYGVQLPLASLIDIVFLLLIYFLLTTNFMVDEGIDVKLPQAEASRPRWSGRSPFTSTAKAVRSCKAGSSPWENSSSGCGK